MPAPAVEDHEEDEESHDWWTKYFASIDTMIEVGGAQSWKKRKNSTVTIFELEILAQKNACKNTHKRAKMSKKCKNLQKCSKTQ